MSEMAVGVVFSVCGRDLDMRRWGAVWGLRGEWTLSVYASELKSTLAAGKTPS